jgi:hypothetical protein
MNSTPWIPYAGTENCILTVLNSSRANAFLEPKATVNKSGMDVVDGFQYMYI